MPRNPRIAFVTGANKGIGFEVARQLVREGFRVFIGARNEKAGKAATEKLNTENKKQANVSFLEIDVSNPASIKRAADQFAQQSDRLDALINNAGILLDEDKDVLTLTPQLFETTLRTNTLGALLVAQAFVPFLRKSESARIVNVSSGGGQLTDGADGWAPGVSPRQRSNRRHRPARRRPARICGQRLSVPVGCELIWAAQMRPVPLRKALRESSGSRRRHHNAENGEVLARPQSDSVVKLWICLESYGHSDGTDRVGLSRREVVTMGGGLRNGRSASKRPPPQ